MKKSSIFAVLVIMAFASVSALAVDYYWNVASGNWSVGSNWDPAGPPASAGVAYIDNGGTANIDVDFLKTVVSNIKVYDGVLNLGSNDIQVTYMTLGAGGEDGIFNISGGTFECTSQVALGKLDGGLAGAGYINVSGGTFDAKTVILGVDTGSYSEFNVTGGTVNVSNNLVIGEDSVYGDAIFRQTGGAVNVANDLLISDYDSNPFGPKDGKGIYKMEGGHLHVLFDLHVGTDDDVNMGELYLKSGVITTTNLFVYDKGYVNDQDATICAGARVNVWGDFINTSSNNLNFNMNRTTVAMMGGGAGWVPDAGDWGEWQYATINMENVVDYGTDYQNGLTNNFAIGNLIFHGTDTDSIWYMVESDIYCYGLVIEEGAVVVLNGGNIYYAPEDADSYAGGRPCTHLIAGTVLSLDGTLVELSDMPEYEPVVPEPGTIVLIGSGVLGLAAVLRRKYC